MKKKIILLSSIAVLMLNISTITVNADKVTISNNQISDTQNAEQAAYYLGEDGVFYATSGVDDYIWDDYSTPEGQYEISELLEKLCTENPEGKFAVQFRFFKTDSKNVINFILSESGSEIDRLDRENIKTRMVTIHGELMMYAVISAEQLKNFPASEKYGYKISLAENMYNMTSVISTEKAKTLTERLKDNYYLGEDGIYYSAYGVDDLYDEAEEKYYPPKSTYETTNLLLALCISYPKGNFAVQLEYPNVPEESEIERLNKNGIAAVRMSKNKFRLYAVMTADQIKSFPADENTGYKMGLAEKDEDNMIISEPNVLLGDIDSSGTVDLTDLTELSLVLVGDKIFTAEQLCAADINENGKADLADLARLKQYLSKVITSL